MIQYTSEINNLSTLNLQGFFVGWPTPPNEDAFIKILRGSYKVILAHDDSKLVGFITAISDGVLSAYIPLLEVLSEYQGQGIGRQLVASMKSELSELYMVDLLCDEALIPFYQQQGMSKAQGACLRNYSRQSGE